MPATGAVSFHLNVAAWNANLFPEIAERLKNLSPLFNEIISEWAKGNEDKFQKSVGAQASGVNFSPEPKWEPLTPAYAKQKARDGFKDWLMVRTGDLKASLTSEEAFFKFVDNERAVFGTPNNPDDADKVKWNWEERQTVFLDSNGMKTISLFWNDFVTLGPKFRDIKNTAVLAQRQMNAEFELRMGAE